jgi:hypothetical protein
MKRETKNKKNGKDEEIKNGGGRENKRERD